MVYRQFVHFKWKRLTVFSLPLQLEWHGCIIMAFTSFISLNMLTLGHVWLLQSLVWSHFSPKTLGVWIGVWINAEQWYFGWSKTTWWASGTLNIWSVTLTNLYYCVCQWYWFSRKSYPVHMRTHMLVLSKFLMMHQIPVTMWIMFSKESPNWHRYDLLSSTVR